MIDRIGETGHEPSYLRGGSIQNRCHGILAEKLEPECEQRMGFEIPLGSMRNGESLLPAS